MKKNYLFIGAAAIMMAGCASDDLVGDENISSGETPIAFSMQNTAVTRGSAEDATKLGNMFIVWGEKNETDDVKASAENLVFQNYVVKHDVTSTTGGSTTTTTNYTANSTTSNTNGWEYVGIDHTDFDTNVKNTIGSGKAQTIKYWDDNSTSYTFTAVSALQSDIKDGKVVITKNVGNDTQTTGKTVCDKGYTVEVKTGASVDNIYYADRMNIAKGTSGYSHNVVELTFRNFMTKIRFGFYETVPGYKVQITGVKYNSTATSPTTGASKLGVDGQFFIVPTDSKTTKYTVTYENGTTANSITTNKAKVSVDADNSASAN